MDPFKILIAPTTTEKSVRSVESNNEIIFVVNQKSTKTMIKKAVEELFKVKVKKIRVVNDAKGRKKAFVKLNREFPAGDINAKLGLM